jgi:pSer/pThr/pTyr-binding forkhead associated (FHA) protein
VAFSPRDFTPAELAERLAAERRGRPFLVYRDAERAQRLLTLEGQRISVGREPGNEFALTWDAEASRVHALLEPVGGSWTVVDDRLSRNGTFVNGALVRGRRRLNDRDVVRFGSTEALYRDPAAGADETPAASSPAGVAEISPAQRRVLVALCRPLLEPLDEAGTPPSNPEIATELTLSIEAVRSHLKTLFKLFEVPDLPQNRKRAELARRALASGVVAPHDLSR